MIDQTRNTCILNVNSAYLAQALGLPEGTLVTGVQLVSNKLGTVQLRIEHPSMPKVVEGTAIPEVEPMCRQESLATLSVDWPFLDKLILVTKATAPKSAAGTVCKSCTYEEILVEDRRCGSPQALSNVHILRIDTLTLRDLLGIPAGLSIGMRVEDGGVFAIAVGPPVCGNEDNEPLIGKPAVIHRENMMDTVSVDWPFLDHLVVIERGKASKDMAGKACKALPYFPERYAGSRPIEDIIEEVINLPACPACNGTGWLNGKQPAVAKDGKWCATQEEADKVTQSKQWHICVLCGKSGLNCNCPATGNTFHDEESQSPGEAQFCRQCHALKVWLDGSELCRECVEWNNLDKRVAQQNQRDDELKARMVEFENTVKEECPICGFSNQLAMMHTEEAHRLYRERQKVKATALMAEVREIMAAKGTELNNLDKKEECVACFMCGSKNPLILASKDGACGICEECYDANKPVACVVCGNLCKTGVCGKCRDAGHKSFCTCCVSPKVHNAYEAELQKQESCPACIVCGLDKPLVEMSAGACGICAECRDARNKVAEKLKNLPPICKKPLAKEGDQGSYQVSIKTEAQRDMLVAWAELDETFIDICSACHGSGQVVDAYRASQCSLCGGSGKRSPFAPIGTTCVKWNDAGISRCGELATHGVQDWLDTSTGKIPWIIKPYCAQHAPPGAKSLSELR